MTMNQKKKNKNQWLSFGISPKNEWEEDRRPAGPKNLK